MSQSIYGSYAYFFTWEGPFVNGISLLFMQQSLIHNSFIQKLWKFVNVFYEFSGNIVDSKTCPELKSFI